MRDAMIPPIVTALREAERIVDDAYMRHLRAMPIQTLFYMFDHWTTPSCVW